MDYGDTVKALFSRLKDKKPLIHNITNFVVMNDTADLLLAAGASPIMAHSCNELEDLLCIADALVINIGTLGTEWVDSMNTAIGIANKYDVPVMLDPVGTGASYYRTDTIEKMLKMYKISVLKGNLGEISSLVGFSGVMSGVDSIGGGDPEEIIKKAYSKYNTIIAITGEYDYVFNGKDLYIIKNNCSLLTRITGSGCMVGSLIASLIALEDDHALAAACGLASFCYAGEAVVREGIRGPADFKVKLIDKIYSLSESINAQSPDHFISDGSSILIEHIRI